MAVSWTVDKADLLEATEILDLVPARPGIPSSEFLKVEKVGKNAIRIYVAAEVSGYVKLKGSGTWPFDDDFYIDRRVLAPFVMASKDLKTSAPFKFTGKKKNLLVKQGSRRAMFASQQQLSGYGLPPSSDMVAKLNLGDELRGLIYCARECSTSDPTAPQLNCVYIEPNGTKVRVYASNKSIVYRAYVKANMKHKHSIPFPLFLVQLLGSEKLRDVIWRDKYVTLRFDHGKIWQPVSAKAKAGFPLSLINQHIKKSDAQPVVFHIKSKTFATVITRLCSYLTAVRRQDWRLDMTASKGDKQLLFTSDCGPAVFKEKVKLEHAPKTDVALTWPLAMIEPVFDFVGKRKNIGDIEIRLNENGHSHVKAGHIELVIPKEKK